MPITELPNVDQRTAFVRELFTILKDDESAQAPYREAHERSVKEAADKAARSEFMRRISSMKKGRRFPGGRPYQSAGFASRAAWEEAGSPEPVIPPTKREQIEARIRRGERKRR